MAAVEGKGRNDDSTQCWKALNSFESAFAGVRDSPLINVLAVG